MKTKNLFKLTINIRNLLRLTVNDWYPLQKPEKEYNLKNRFKFQSGDDDIIAEYVL